MPGVKITEADRPALDKIASVFAEGTVERLLVNRLRHALQTAAPEPEHVPGTLLWTCTCGRKFESEKALEQHMAIAYFQAAPR